MSSDDNTPRMLGDQPVNSSSWARSSDRPRVGRIGELNNPGPSAESQNDTAIRHITFWSQGFQIEDGELLRYDNPGNSAILAQINAGTAPPALMNVREGQHIELRVAKRTHEEYVPPQGLRA